MARTQIAAELDEQVNGGSCRLIRRLVRDGNTCCWAAGAAEGWSMGCTKHARHVWAAALHRVRGEVAWAGRAGRLLLGRSSVPPAVHATAAGAPSPGSSIALAVLHDQNPKHRLLS